MCLISFKCRTKCPAYIELINLTAAQTVIETRNFTELAGRKVKITLATKRELMCAVSVDTSMFE